MVSGNEREQLEKTFQQEPVSVLGTLLTCAIGLMVVVAFALIGFDVHTDDGALLTKQTVSQTP